MKKLVCKKPKDLALIDIETDAVPEGWVPLDIACVGICGTDYHIYLGNQPFLKYPRVMGHEVSAWVSREYRGDNFKSGDLLILNPYFACDDCHACKNQKPNCCENVEVFGVHRDGAMAEKFAAPPQNLISAEGLTPEQAAMVEFLAIGCHGVARSSVSPGSKALIVGAGPIGLAAAIFARLGGCHVTMLDVSAKKATLLKQKFGLHVVHPSDHQTMQSLQDKCDHVFDATGNINAMNSGLKFVNNGGTYTLLSIVQQELRFPDPEFHKKEVTLFASRNANRTDFTRVIKAIRDGEIDTYAIATHRTNLENAALDINRWAGSRDDVIKAIIEVTA